MHGQQQVLVTGATGTIGPVLIRSLQDRGYRVRALVRNPPPPAGLPDGTYVLRGDILDSQALEVATDGAEIVFHLAAKLHVNNPSLRLRNEYERVNVEGTQHVVNAARAAGVRRLVFFSTISVYGPTGAQPVDEMAMPRPDTVYAETKLRAEQLALSAKHANSGRPLAVVLRMAAVYGPRVRGNYQRLARALAQGRFIPVGNGSNLRTLVYVEDAVRAAILASQHPLAAGRIYNVSDGAVRSLREIISAICEALGRRPPGIYLPVRPARSAAVALDRALALAGGSPRLVSAIDKLAESVAVRADRIQHELGFRPMYDLRHGWQETVAAWQRSGTVS